MDKLLKLLSRNSEYSVSDLALMLGEPEDYVRARIQKYEDDGIIKGYRALVNYEKVKDAGVTAYIELKVTPQRKSGFDEIAKRIMAFDEVESVYLMAGAYDLSIIVKGETIQDVSAFVSRKLSALDGILSTATHFILKRYKDDGVVLEDEDNSDERCMNY
ncbi:MAG: Lrp/AsnC family transcriptional regulator [Clostridia bacterium]|nr:Lrp/AsnC family transcriptional regulator [Clostridia bacterium]